MKNNPVYKREMLVRSRSFRIPLIIMIFNGILAVVALLNMYQSIAQVKVSGSVRYENFLQLYAFVAALEFMLLMFIMPALTSASISGERERHTLELMFTTKIWPSVGASMPNSIFIKVDFPAPFSPTRAWISPFLICRLTLWFATTPPG